MNTLSSLDEAKDSLARALKSCVQTVNGQVVLRDDYPLIADKTRAVADALNAHLAVDPSYEWHAGKLLASCFGAKVKGDPTSPAVDYAGSGHPYFPVQEWVDAEGDAGTMRDWLRGHVAWLES